LSQQDDPVQSLVLDAVDWKVIEDFVDFLKPLYDITLAVSKEKSPTMQLVYPSFVVIKRKMELKCNASTSPSVKRAAQAALEKLKKYFDIADSDCNVVATGMALPLFSI
jgi:hypothetical protein